MKTFKKKIAIAKLVVLLGLLDNAKGEKLRPKERYALGKLVIAVRKGLNDYEELEKETVKRLRPENHDETEALINELRGMEEDKRLEALQEEKFAEAVKKQNEYNSAINECLAPERMKEVEVEIEAQSPEWRDRLLESNPGWTGGQLALLVNLIEE